MDKLKLIKKEVIKKEDYGQEVKENRWFVETNDGFDGTAQGYGYKTPQSLYKAYGYFKNKNSRKNDEKLVKKFLNENLDVKTILNSYLDPDWWIDREKDGDPTSIEDMIETYKEESVVIDKLIKNKHLWKQLIKYAES